jgi:hypothetical protein
MQDPYTVEIRAPLGERATMVAEQEDMELDDFVDFVLRDYMREWESSQNDEGDLDEEESEEEA